MAEPELAKCKQTLVTSATRLIYRKIIFPRRWFFFPSFLLLDILAHVFESHFDFGKAVGDGGWILLYATSIAANVDCRIRHLF